MVDKSWSDHLLAGVLRLLGQQDSLDVGQNTTLSDRDARQQLVQFLVITRAPSKSCEMDPIPTDVLKKFPPELLPYITDMCNSVQQGSFYRAMLCIRGTSHGPVSVSVCLSVCHKSEFY